MFPMGSENENPAPMKSWHFAEQYRETGRFWERHFHRALFRFGTIADRIDGSG
jgi:hypothetical protein